MNYLYYPGCSLEGSAREYDLSCRAFLTAVGAELTENETARLRDKGLSTFLSGDGAWPACWM